MKLYIINSSAGGLIKYKSFFIFLKNEITCMKFLLNSNQKDLIK